MNFKRMVDNIEQNAERNVEIKRLQQELKDCFCWEAKYKEDFLESGISEEEYYDEGFQAELEDAKQRSRFAAERLVELGFEVETDWRGFYYIKDEKED